MEAQRAQKTTKMMKVRQAMEEMAMGVIWTTVKTHRGGETLVGVWFGV